MVAVRWTPRARRDLRLIRQYIERDPVRAAAQVVERIARSVEVLATFPCQGRMVPEYGDETIRELIVENYRVIYRLRGDRVSIAAVMHAIQGIERYLGGGSSWSEA